MSGGIYAACPFVDLNLIGVLFIGFLLGVLYMLITEPKVTRRGKK